MPTAQETYTKMIKARIAPALRALGFKGSGQNYELPSPVQWAMLGFQKSMSSDASELKFTMNVLVVPRDVWDKQRAEHSYLGPRPTANTLSGSFVWQHRIGDLFPRDEDLWWEVQAGRDTEEVAAAVYGR